MLEFFTQIQSGKENTSIETRTVLVLHNILSSANCVYNIIFMINNYNVMCKERWKLNRILTSEPIYVLFVNDAIAVNTNIWERNETETRWDPICIWEIPRFSENGWKKHTVKNLHRVFKLFVICNLNSIQSWEWSIYVLRSRVSNLYNVIRYILKLVLKYNNKHVWRYFTWYVWS